jgi:DNA-binding SARP family transcriptional activator
MLEIKLLGGFRLSNVNYDGLPKKARALMAYLAMNRGRAIPRDQLADLLWSDSGPEQGRHSLRQSLAALRRLLGSGRRDLIATIGSDVLLAASDAVIVDACRFETLALSAELADLSTANDLYRSEFLADLDVPSEPFMEWVGQERARLEAMACAMLHRLATARSNAGQQEAAINAAQRLIALDPLREDGHRLLMQFFADVGRRAEAIRQFATCRDHLRRELNVTPDEKTIALVAAIRSGGSTPGQMHASLSADAAVDRRGAVVDDLDATDAPSAGWQFEHTAADAAANQVGPETARNKWGQRRQLTIMASELTGLACAAQSDAEDSPETAETCYRRCAQIVKQHHGFVARSAGDGLLAYFGYPEAHEQDAENAARAALALHACAGELSAELGIALQPCTGISTGTVMIRQEPATGERADLGEALTLSGRLQALAKPGQILVANSTRRLLGSLFDYVDLGQVTLKGLPIAVEIAQLLGESDIVSRFEAHHPAKLPPLVGRGEEVELLLRRWRKATDGEGSVVLLVGEPGIGKSRLAQTLQEHLGSETPAIQRLFCSPHRQDSPLYPFINQLERAAQFRRGDSNEQRLAKLEQALTEAGDRNHARSLFAHLLSIPTGDRDPSLTLTPQQRKEKTLEALATHVERLATSRPLLLIVEDLHWADPTSLELIDLIVERAPRRRILVLLTSRPEFVSPWADRDQTMELALGRLTPRHCAAIIAGVVEGPALPEAVTKEIIRRADGVPLFVEELTKSVVESGVLAEAYAADMPIRPMLEIPMTLQASLLARLDRLASAREVVQIGAALGRHFSYQLISAVALIPQQRLSEALTNLVEAGLIWRRGSPPDAEYTFKHALIQDAAFGTLRKEARRVLHARIADTLETHFAQIAATQPELLAHHYTEAGLNEKAASQWGKAGQLSLTRSALKEAAVQLTRALGLIETLPATSAWRREQIKLQIALANALMHTKGYAAPETKQALQRARLLVEQAEVLGEPPEDPLLLLSVLHGFWVASHVGFDGDAVRGLAADFMAIAERQRTAFPLVLAHRVMGTSLLFLGDIAGGRIQLDRAMSLYDPVEHRPLATRFGQEAGVAILSNRPLALWLLGYPDQAQKDAGDALTYARDLGQTATFLYALTRIAWIEQVIGNYAAAEAQTQELMAIAHDMEGSYWTAAGTMLQGCLFALTGKGVPAIDMITSGIKASRLTGSNLLRMPWYLSCLVRAHVALGQRDDARRCLSEALAAMATTQESWQEAELHRIAGDLASMSCEPKAAQAHYERALVVAREQKAKAWELRAAMGLARLWRDQGKPKKASGILAPVYHWFSEGFDTPDLREAERLMAELR